MSLKMSLSDVGNIILDIANRTSLETRDIIDKFSVHKLELSANAFVTELRKVQQYIIERKDLVEKSKVLDKDSPQDIEDLINLLSNSDVSPIVKEGVTFKTLSEASSQYKKDLLSGVTDNTKRTRYANLLKKIELGHSSSSALTEKYRSDLAELNTLLNIVREQKSSNDSEKSVIIKSEKMILTAIQQLRIALYTSTQIDKNLHGTIMGNSISGLSIDSIIDYFNSVASKLLSKKSFTKFTTEYLPRYIDIKTSAKTEHGYSITVSFENWLDNSEKGNYGRMVNQATNAILLNVVQAGIDSSQLSRFKSNLAKTKKELMEGFTTLSTKVKTKVLQLAKEELSASILDISASPTYKEHLKSILIGKLTNTKVNNLPGSAKTKTNNIKSSSKDISSNVSINKISKVKKPSSKVPATLRNLQGQFTSLTSLESLMRSQLQQTILKNMQRPNLRERTGRFRKSVELKGLSRLRDGSIQAFLTYMRYPYGTFEPGGRQGNKGYSPTRLIDQSVREVAAKLVKERMKVTVQ